MAGIVEEIAENRRVSLELEREVSRVRSRYTAMAEDDDPRPKTNIVDQIQQEVNRRVPVDSLFYPTETNIRKE
jgi:hypothetical protein